MGRAARPLAPIQACKMKCAHTWSKMVPVLLEVLFVAKTVVYVVLDADFCQGI